MATLLDAVRTYGPSLRLGITAQMDDVANLMAVRTGFNRNEVMMVLQELQEIILYFNRLGMPVKLPGVGTFAPSLDRAGRYRIHLRIDAALKKGINLPETYKGRIHNKQNIGLDNTGYKQLWDADHPTDPLLI